MVDELRATSATVLIVPLFLVSLFLVLPVHSFAAETGSLETLDVETSDKEAGDMEALPEDPGSDVPELAAGAKADDEELPSEGESAGQADGTGDYSNLVSYDCGQGRMMQIHYIAQGVDEYALLIVDGEIKEKLEIALSGSGARYASQDLEWHTKANQGLLTRKGRALTCVEVAFEKRPLKPADQPEKKEWRNSD